MKILLVATTDMFGGASRAMFRLHKGLREIGLESTILCLEKHSVDEFVIPLDIEEYPRSLKENLSDEMISRYTAQKAREVGSNFNFPASGYSISEHPLVRNADIINLHWVTGFLSVEEVSKITSLGKPVIWTFHDEWAFTAGCHYSFGCGNFTENCNICPQLGGQGSDFTTSILERRAVGFSKINTIVTPSVWLGDQTKKSRVFRNTPVKVIPYSIESDIFSPKSKKESKIKLGLDPSELTILFGADDGSDKRKGFHLLAEAFFILASSQEFLSIQKSKKIRLLVFGFPSPEIKKLAIPYTLFGRIDNDEKMSDLYSAADVFLLPSLEDNLPNTMLESFASGTPVISFRKGGMPDMIITNQNGLLCEEIGAQQFAETILNFLKLETNARILLGINARKLIEDSYQLEVQANRYKNLFNNLIQKKEKQNNLDLKLISNSSPVPLTLFESVYENLIESELRYKNQVSETILYYREKGGTDFLYAEEIRRKLKISFYWTSFEIKFSLLPLEHLEIEELYWIPIEFQSLELFLEDFTLLDSERREVIPSLVTSHADYFLGNHIKFYSKMSKVIFSFPPGRYSEFKLRGRMRVLSNADAHIGLQGLIGILKQNSLVPSKVRNILKKIPFLKSFVNLIRSR